jgi:XPA protein C-terminus
MSLCKTILKSGKNIGKQCGRKNCNYHKNQPIIIINEAVSIKISTFLSDLPSVLLGYTLSFVPDSIFEVAVCNHECYRAINNTETFSTFLPKYVLSTLPKVDLEPLRKLKLWRDEHQVCQDLYCPLSLNNGKDCSYCCNTICKSRALGSYFLTEKDISKLQFSKARNPCYRSAPPMKLYRKRDIREIALKKYKSWTKIFRLFISWT